MKELLEKCQGSVLSETKEHLYSDFKSGSTDIDVKNAVDDQMIVKKL